MSKPHTRTLCWLLAALLPVLSACQRAPSSASAEVGQKREGELPAHVRLANPASEHCIKVGGKLTIAHQLDGGEYGICQLPDGKRCEEWALMRGTCPR